MHFDTLHTLKGSSFKTHKDSTCSNSVYMTNTFRTTSWFHRVLGVCVEMRNTRKQKKDRLSISDDS